MSTVQEIEQAALKLPRKARVALAERLIVSAETKRDKEIAALWADEAQTRAEAYRQGRLKSVPLRKAFGFDV